MKIYTNFCVFISLCVVSFFTTLSLAEEINLSDENVAKDLLLGKALYYDMDEQYYHGPIKIKIVSIKGNKYKGMSKEWCYKDITWTGKLRKNQMTVNQQGTSVETCFCRNGTLTVFKDNDGILRAEGKYELGCGAKTTFKPKLKCIVASDLLWQ